MKGSDTGLRWRARLDIAWAREPWGTRVRAGMAREPLLLEGLEVRVVDDGFFLSLETTHFLKVGLYIFNLWLHWGSIALRAFSSCGK